jgi:hypothetical protein
MCLRISVAPNASPLRARYIGGHVPVMRAIPPPPPAIDYPTKKSSTLYSGSAKGKMGKDVDDIAFWPSSRPSTLDTTPPSTEGAGKKKWSPFSSLLDSSRKSATDVKSSDDKPSNKAPRAPSPGESRPYGKHNYRDSGYTKSQASPPSKDSKSYFTRSSPKVCMISSAQASHGCEQCC